MSTLTIRLTDEENETLMKIRAQEEVATSSKMIKKMIGEHIKKSNDADKIKTEIFFLKEQLEEIKDTIRMRSNAKKLLNKHTTKLTYLANK